MLLAAQSIAPQSPTVLRALAQFDNQAGQKTRAVELSLAAARAAGPSGRTLRQIAGRFAALGLLERAELALPRSGAAR